MSTWCLTQGWKVLGLIPNAHSLTGSIPQSRNLKNDQPIDKIQSYSYLWSIPDKTTVDYSILVFFLLDQFPSLFLAD